MTLYGSFVYSSPAVALDFLSGLITLAIYPKTAGEK